MNNQLQSKVQLLRQAGIPEAVIAQRVKRQFGVDINQQAAPVPAKPAGLIQSLINPAKKYAGMLGEAANLGGYKLGGGDMSQYKPRFMSEADLGKFATPGGAATEGAKRIAGAASYVIPGGSTVGGMALRGAASGALNAYSEDQDITSGAVGGAAGGVIGGKTIPWVFRKVGQLFGGAGDRLATSVVQPKVSPSPFAAEEEKAIVQGLQKLGLRGSPQAQREAMPAVFRQIGDQIDQVLTATPQTVKRDVVKQSVSKALQESINYDPSIPAYKTAADKFLKQVMKGTQADVDARVLFQTKQNLGKQLSRAFTKIERGNPLTPQEEVGVAIWGAIDDMLPQGVRSLTRMQSMLYKASTGLATSAKKGVSAPIIGRLPGAVSEPIQAVESVVGAGMQGVAPAGQKAASGLNAPITSRISGAPSIGEFGGRMLGTQMARPGTSQPTEALPPEPQTEQPILSPGGQWRWDPQSNDWVPNQAQAQTGQMDKQAVAQAMLQNPKYASVIKSAYEMMNPQQKTSTSQTMKQRENLGKSGLQSVEEVESLLGVDYNANTVSHMDTLAKQAIPLQPFTRRFDSAVYNAVDALLRLRTGAQANPAEIKGYTRKIGPSLGDDQATVIYKLQQLKSALMLEIQNPTPPETRSQQAIPDSPSLMYGGME